MLYLRPKKLTFHLSQGTGMLIFGKANEFKTFCYSKLQGKRRCTTWYKTANNDIVLSCHVKADNFGG